MGLGQAVEPYTDAAARVAVARQSKKRWGCKSPFLKRPRKKGEVGR
jgi:hypothetical protein